MGFLRWTRLNHQTTDIINKYDVRVINAGLKEVTITLLKIALSLQPGYLKLRTIPRLKSL